MMKGLDLCEQYFHRFGKPMILEKFPRFSRRMAAGLVGDGSECFGYDDDLSKDHDWGPGFCIWLAESDYHNIGGSLAEEISKLPKTFLGYGPRVESRWGFGRIGVFQISNFYKSFIGLEGLPETPEEWLYLPENSLAACTNGKVFYDPLREFTTWREKLLLFYPEDIRRKKIASRCMTMAQFGQYNFKRCVQRKEMVAAKYAETKFCADAISMVYLLNKKYTPFFKWMHRGLINLPKMGQWTYSKILKLITINSADEKGDLIEQICTTIIAELNHQGLSDSKSTFLLDHGPVVQNTIADESVRNRNVWVG